MHIKFKKTMNHTKCHFLTIFLDCSWLWKQGLKSFLLALQVRLLNGMFTCWELFMSHYADILYF